MASIFFLSKRVLVFRTIDIQKCEANKICNNGILDGFIFLNINRLVKVNQFNLLVH